QRTTRRLALTKVGEQFAQECQTLVNQSERARAVVQAVQEYPQVSASGSSKQYVVTGDYSKPETVGNDSDVWTVTGKSGNTIKVT
ncbi:hypothetical protein MJI95_37255, partial [Salmonella enterica subsp. enterica serovar Kentucky]|nr:hypothetical protein [Salmonella enterica subsp. enterica serovar Kentucky]